MRIYLSPTHHTSVHASHSHFCYVQSQRAAMEFTDDPFKDYRYEDPFNIEDPFADVTDSNRPDPFGRPSSVPRFESDDFFVASSTINGSFTLPEKRSGRASAPPAAYDPFASRSDPPDPSLGSQSTRDVNGNNSNNNEAWSAWPNDNWASDDAWSKPAQNKDAWPAASKNTTPNTVTNDWKTDNWANKTDNWATEWNSDTNKNLNETWPTTSSTNTLPNKKEKSPKPVKYAKSLVHTIGGIGRAKQKNKKEKAAQLEARSSEAIPTEEQQWAWAAAESKRLEKEAEKRRMQEDAELQLALAISRQEK